MIESIKNWKGIVAINRVRYNSVSEIPSDFELTDDTMILLCSNSETSADKAPQASDTVFRVTVKQYMLKPSTPSFDFMLKFNKDIPMPLRTMIGTIKKETTGMYQMELKADTDFEQVQTCMKCGRPITNSVSKFFGMGPECGQHDYTNPFNSDEELNQAIQNYKKEYLGNIYWCGWVIKSAIVSIEEVK